MEMVEVPREALVSLMETVNKMTQVTTGRFDRRSVDAVNEAIYRDNVRASSPAQQDPREVKEIQDQWERDVQ